MSAAIGPVASRVRGERDPLGPICADCFGTVYLHRIERGRPVYRHVESKPPCLFDAKGKPR